MQPQNQSTQPDFSHWIKDFDLQRVELEKQMQQFKSLQQEIEGLVEQAPNSPKAAQQLQRLQQLQQSSEYIQLHDQTLSKLQQLESKFSQLSQALVPSPTQLSATSSHKTSSKENSRVKNRPPRTSARPFI